MERANPKYDTAEPVSHLKPATAPRRESTPTPLAPDAPSNDWRAEVEAQLDPADDDRQG